MNRKKLVKYMSYAFYVLMGVYLVHYSYLGISMDGLAKIRAAVKFEWVVLAMLAHLINHFFRAVRWRVFVEVQGYKVSNTDAFLGEMSGFFMNLLYPRLGEWGKCAVLKRLRSVPISKSLGGVVVERFIEVFLFSCLVFVALMMEFSTNTRRLLNFGEDLKDGHSVLPKGKVLMIVGGAVVVLVLVVMLLKRVQKQFIATIWEKVKRFSKELFMAIGHIRKANGLLVWIVSLFILFFHFLVEYLSFYAMEDIGIDLQGALYVFIMMNIGMSAPTPGGIGVYHLGVTSALMALGAKQEYAIVYATLTHGVQAFNALVIGGGTFLISIFLGRKRKRDGVKSAEVDEGSFELGPDEESVK